jgi:hypothetical protein
MKPYIQIIGRTGSISFMHDPEVRGEKCCCDVCSEPLNLFEIDVYDAKGFSVGFEFSPENAGEIFAKLFGKDTVTCIKTILEASDEIWLNIEERELYYGESEKNGWDENLINAIINREAFEDRFFYRLTEQSDGKWVLSLVFWDQEIGSEPTEWVEFTPVESE